MALFLFVFTCFAGGVLLWTLLNMATGGRLRTAQRRFYRNLNEKYGMGSIKDHDDSEDT